MTSVAQNPLQFDINNPRHADLLQEYYDLQAIAVVQAAGHEVETADEAWTIIKTENLMERLQTHAMPTLAQ